MYLKYYLKRWESSKNNSQILSNDIHSTFTNSTNETEESRSNNLENSSNNMSMNTDSPLLNVKKEDSSNSLIDKLEIFRKLIWDHICNKNTNSTGIIKIFEKLNVAKDKLNLKHSLEDIQKIAKERIKLPQDNAGRFTLFYKKISLNLRQFNRNAYINELYTRLAEPNMDLKKINEFIKQNKNNFIGISECESIRRPKFY